MLFSNKSLSEIFLKFYKENILVIFIFCNIVLFIWFLESGGCKFCISVIIYNKSFVSI